MEAGHRGIVMSVSFEMLDAEHGVFRYPSDPFDRVVEAFDAMLDRRDCGDLGDGQYAAELGRLVEVAPDFIDGHAHLAFALDDQEKPKKALEHCLHGLAVGNRLIPEGFAGRIE